MLELVSNVHPVIPTFTKVLIPNVSGRVSASVLSGSGVVQVIHSPVQTGGDQPARRVAVFQADSAVGAPFYALRLLQDHPAGQH